MRQFMVQIVVQIMVLSGCGGAWGNGGVACGQSLTPLVVKQVSAPPSDIVSGIVALPDPAEVGETSSSALLEVRPPSTGGERWVWSADLPVGAEGGRVVFLPAKPDAWVVRAVSPDGLSMDPRNLPEMPGLSYQTEGFVWSRDGHRFDCLLMDGTHRGAWRIEIESSGAEGGYVLVGLSPGKELYTHRSSLKTLVGEPVTLASSFTDGSPVSSARAWVRTPGGREYEVSAPSGVADATFVPDEVGAYSVRVIAEGLDGSGGPLRLTTQHLIDIALPAAPLGRAGAGVEDGRVVFRFSPQPAHRRVILAGEVWGDRGGEMVPVCWLSRICGEERSLALDPRWIALAGVDPATLELRQVRVHDVDTMTLLELQAVSAVPVAGLTLPDPPSVITEDMLVSASPAPVMTRSGTGRGVLPPGHRLLFVHGYCAPGNPYPTGHFTGSHAAFHNPDANLSHDEFALEILDQTAQMKSFGVAAHSQGGLAALHLYTFYFSPMDWARGDRLIQSIGSPYRGTPLAGNAAILGNIFGIGCGLNPGLTYAGAQAWLSTIPTSSRQQVWFWRTTFHDSSLILNDYCSLISDILLTDPEDGVVESHISGIPGANNMGLTEGWCHTADMRDPQQTTAAGRNAEINTRARR